MKKLILGLILSLSFLNGQAVTKTWVGTSANWAVAGNWSPVGIPGSADDVIFSNNKNCSINTVVGVNSISIASTYSATISRPTAASTNRSVTVNNFSIAGGTFNLSQSNSVGAVIVNNNTVITGGVADFGATSSMVNLITISGGTFRLGAAISINSNFIMTGGIFNSGSSQINFLGSVNNTGGIFNTSLSGAAFFGDNTTISGNFIFNNITFSTEGISDRSFYVVGSLTTVDQFQVDPQDFILTLSRDPIYLQGNFDVFNSVFQTTGTLVSNNLFVFNGTTAQSVGLVSDISGGYIFELGGGIQFNNTAAGVTLTSIIDNTNLIGGGVTIVGGSLDDGGFDITLPANQNFVVSNGTTFTCSAASLPAVSGTGKFVLNGATTVNLTGAIPQSLPYSLLYNDLTINKTFGDVTISAGTTSISGFLTIAALGTGNKLKTNGNLVLTSNATSTGSLIDFSTAGSGGSVNGNITVQRYAVGISSTVGHYFSSPIINAPFSTIAVSGFQTLMYSENGIPPRLANSFLGSFRKVPNVGVGFPTFMTPGRGFSTVQPNTATIGFTGVPNNGDISYTVTCSTDIPSIAGWNFIGNPYPSAIDWGNVDKVAGIGAAYVYSVTGYITVLNSPNNYISSGQGFFVRANVTTTGSLLTFKNADRVSSNLSSTANHPFGRQEAGLKYLYFDMKSDVPGLAANDAVIFSFSPEASDGFDSFDAYKLYNPSPLPNLYMSIDNNAASVNVMSDQSYNKTVPLNFYVRKNGLYEFSARNLNDFYPDIDVFLIDADSSDVPDINLKNVSKYQFYHSTTSSGTRFSIKFSSSGTSQNPGATIPGVVTTPGNQFFVDLPGFVAEEISVSNTVDQPDDTTEITSIDDAQAGFKMYAYRNKVYFKSGIVSISKLDEVEIFDIIGNKIGGYTNLKLEDTTSIEINKRGIYIVKVLYGNKLHVKKVIIN